MYKYNIVALHKLFIYIIFILVTGSYDESAYCEAKEHYATDYCYWN